MFRREQTTADIFVKTFEKLIDMPYVSNWLHSNKKHEARVETILKDLGYKKLDKKCLNDDDLIKKSKTNPGGKVANGNRNITIPLEAQTGNWYVLQSMGDQQPPDFILIVNSVVVYLECKSCKKDTISWNDNLPKDEYVYLFSEQKSNQSTIFLGRSLMTSRLRWILSSGINMINKIAARLNKILLSLNNDNPSGFTYYPRPKYSQQGGKSKASFINHPDRESREKEVFDFLKSL